MITRQGQSARITLMPPLAQGLRYACSADACLTCAGWVHTNNYTPSIFRFVRDEVQELCPASIVDAFCESHSRQAFDVQILDRNQSVPVDDLSTFFVMEICALCSYVCVNSLQGKHALTSTIRTFLTPRYAPLGDSQLAFSFTVVAWILNGRSVTQNGKRSQAHVNANGVWIEGKCSGLDFTNKDRKPAFGLALDCHRLDYSTERAMQLDADAPNFRDSEFIPTQSVADLPKGHGIIASKGSKSGVSSLLSRLNATKERFEGFINTDNDILKRLGHYRRYVIALLANLPKLVCLVKSVDRLTFQFPSISTLLKGRVIKFTAERKLSAQRLLLAFGWINPKAVNFVRHVGRVLSRSALVRLDLPFTRLVEPFVF